MKRLSSWWIGNGTRPTSIVTSREISNRPAPRAAVLTDGNLNVTRNPPIRKQPRLPLLPSRYSYLKFLVLCVHDSSLWTQLFVSTKTIIFDYSYFVHTVRIGRLRLIKSCVKRFCCAMGGAVNPVGHRAAFRCIICNREVGSVTMPRIT